MLWHGVSQIYLYTPPPSPIPFHWLHLLLFGVPSVLLLALLLSPVYCYQFHLRCKPIDIARSHPYPCTLDRSRVGSRCLTPLLCINCFSSLYHHNIWRIISHVFCWVKNDPLHSIRRSYIHSVRGLMPTIILITVVTTPWFPLLTRGGLFSIQHVER